MKEALYLFFLISFFLFDFIMSLHKKPDSNFHQPVYKFLLLQTVFSVSLTTKEHS